MTLFSMVLAAVLQIEYMGLRAQMRSAAAMVVSANVVLARQALVGALQPACDVLSPAPGSRGPSLTVLHNYDAELRQPLISGLPAELSYFCVDEGKRRLFLYRGPVTAAFGDCGSLPGLGVERVLVAGGDNFRVTADFSRPPAANNLVAADFTVSLRHASLTTDTTVTRHLEVGFRHALR